MDKLASLRKKYASLADTWSPFDVLEVPGNATLAEIQRAFLQLSAVYHPDRYYGKALERKMATAVFERLVWARDELRLRVN